MNWYKQANNDAFVYDMYDMIQEQYGNILAEYFAPSRQKGSQVSWSVIPASRINKIWRDYARTGVVRDEKGLMQIQEQMMSNLARLNACNTLAGHSQEDSGVIIEDQGFPPIDGKNIDFYFDFLDTQYGPPVSDYGLPQLWDLAFQLTPTMSAEERLLILDQFLNVVHQRGDLAALFIEGGAGSLTDLSAGSKGWYRKARKAQSGSKTSSYADGKHYYSIGHSDQDILSGVWLWIINHGKLITHKVDKETKYHGQFMGSRVADFRTVWQGRYSKRTNTCSLNAPMDFRGRPVPEPILNQLYDEFGHDIKIVEFQ